MKFLQKYIFFASYLNNSSEMTEIPALLQELHYGIDTLMKKLQFYRIWSRLGNFSNFSNFGNVNNSVNSVNSLNSFNSVQVNLGGA